MASLFGSLCAPTPTLTEVPDTMAPHDEIDRTLRRVFKALDRETKLDVLWVGAYTDGWQIEKDPATGKITGRYAPLGFIQQTDKGCLLTGVAVYEAYTLDGYFTHPELDWVTPEYFYQPHAGQPIDCGVVDRLNFGFGVRSSGPAETSKPAETDEPSEESQPVTTGEGDGA